MMESSSSNKRKRGMKPRSKRNRKRPRGGVGLPFWENDTKEQHSIQIHLEPLVFPTTDLTHNNKSNPEAIISSPTPTSTTTSTQHKRLRIIQPYPFTFSTFCKARWIGKSLLDVYATEFGSYPASYYQSAIREGRILVSGEKVECEYKVKGGDELCHVVHRHEPPVALHGETENEELISISK